jgi:hypothetical protein
MSLSTAVFRETAFLPRGLVADIVRMENGILAEHWDIIQDEATREQSKSGAPMFGETCRVGGRRCSCFDRFISPE